MAPQTIQDTNSELSQKAERLLAYLSAEVESKDGPIYTKAKFISEDIELSSKEIGGIIPQLQEADTSITIVEWSYTDATTWKLTSDHE